MRSCVILISIMLSNITCASGGISGDIHGEPTGSYSQGSVMYPGIFMYYGIPPTGFSFVIDSNLSGGFNGPPSWVPGRPPNTPRPLDPVPPTPTPIPAPHAILLGLFGVVNAVLVRKRLV